MSISKEIKFVRQKVFMTQEAFAKALSVAYSTVNRWEAGKTIPSMTAMKNIKKLCDENDISFNELQNAWISRTNG